MDKQQAQLAIGGELYFKHYREGKLIDQGIQHNLFVNEGLVYALNSAFGVSVGGAPSPYAGFYVGLTTANRVWQATDKAGDPTVTGIHTVGAEFEGYSEAARPSWNPQALSTISAIELSDTGGEATYNITVGGTIYGGFVISSSTKNGTGDTTAVLIAGANFTGGARVLEIGDVFKVGYTLSTADDGV